MSGYKYEQKLVCAVCQYAYMEDPQDSRQNKCVDICPDNLKYADLGDNGKYVCRDTCKSGAFVYNDSFSARPSKFVCLQSKDGSDCDKFYMYENLKRCVNCTEAYFRIDSSYAYKAVCYSTCSPGYFEQKSNEYAYKCVDACTSKFYVQESSTAAEKKCVD